MKKLIFKTETYKLTLHIKFVFVFPSGNSAPSMSDTIVNLPNKFTQRELLQSRLEWLPGNHSGFVQGTGSPQGKGRRGNEEPIQQTEPQWSYGFPEQSTSFQSTPVEPEWLFQEHTAGSGCVSINTHPYGTAVTACCTMEKLALTNSHGMQGHNLEHTCGSRGADRCMPGLTNTTQEPHFPALPAELEFGDTHVVLQLQDS